jgi:hypothetical protein
LISAPAAREQLIEGIGDHLPLIGQIAHTLAQLLAGHRHHVQRVQHQGLPLDFEHWVHARACHFGPGC